MELLEALNNIKYPEDKMVDEYTTNPELLGFNKGWNELRCQLYSLLEGKS